MYDPNSVEAIIHALSGAGGGSMPNQAMPAQPPMQQMAGQVMPLPITPGPNAGPVAPSTTASAIYNKTAIPMPPDQWGGAWLRRLEQLPTPTRPKPSEFNWK